MHTGTTGSADNPLELLDLLDEQGRVTGTVRRGDVHGNPALRHRAVHVVVRNAWGDIWLQKRGSRKRIQPGKWDTSVGGHVPAGHTYEESALRETDEELGLKVADPARFRIAHDYVWSNEVETEHIRTFILEDEGPFLFSHMEINDGRFWTVQEIRAAVGTEILTPNLEEELRRLGILDSYPLPKGERGG